MLSVVSHRAATGRAVVLLLAVGAGLLATRRGITAQCFALCRRCASSWPRQGVLALQCGGCWLQMRQQVELAR